MFKKTLRFLKPLVRNYYLMAGLFFVVWMIFFDSNNAISQFSNRKVLKELLKQREYYVSEIAANKAMVHTLTDRGNLKAIEKYAREKYLLKRPNEDIFLIVRELQKEK